MGGNACTGQILNLTQSIENVYERKLVTGTVFILLTVAYDKFNHRIIFEKMYKITSNYNLVAFIPEKLKNKIFFMNLQGKKSGWRINKNGLTQGSVLPSLLFNMYTNDQPTPLKTRGFIYADDLALTVQNYSFENIETTLNNSLEEISTIFNKKNNWIKPNPNKTQVCNKNKETKQTIRVMWKGVD